MTITTSRLVLSGVSPIKEPKPYPVSIRFWDTKDECVCSYSWEKDSDLLKEKLRNLEGAVDAEILFVNTTATKVSTVDIYVKLLCDITEICRLLEIGDFK